MHLFIFPFPLAMEKQLEDLKQQLEKQCLINQELQRQNKDLGESLSVILIFNYFIS